MLNYEQIDMPEKAVKFIFLFSLVCLTICCRKPVTPDEALLPNQDGLQLSILDSFTLNSYTVREDSVKTTNLDYSLLGVIEDPVFGKSEAAIYAQVLLASSAINFGSNPQLDSVVLYLNRIGEYGNISSPLNILVHELDEDLVDGEAYYSNRSLAVKSLGLGGRQVIPANEDDTIAIRLSNKFGNDLLDESGGSNLANTDAFLTFFKGIKIAAMLFSDDNNNTNFKTAAFTQDEAKGSILYLNLESSGSKITLFYTNDGQSQQVDFVITSNSITFNQYQHDYTNSLSGQFIGDLSTDGDSLVFITSMQGTKGFIELPDLSMLGDVLINKAAVSFTQVFPLGQDTTLTPPDEMILIKVADDGSNDFSLPDIFEGADHYGGFKSLEINNEGELVAHYEFNIARHVQQVINNEVADNGLYLLSAPSALIADKVVLGGGTHSRSNIEFKLIYTQADL